MEHIIEHLPHILLHTLEETARLIPFLFLTYLLMEFLEHKSGDVSAKWLRSSGKVGPLLGGLFGIVPQCGFSAAASSLYSGRIITVGTLLAVFLSTSDEMLPILISHEASVALILKLLLTKLVIGVGIGFAADAGIRAIRRNRKLTPREEPTIEDLCERENCRCGEHFAVSAFRHTVYITIFIFLFTLAINLTVHGVGEDKLAALLSSRPILGNLLAASMGLFPNCASSVVLTELYLSGMLPVGALLSGLLVNAGIGLAILFRNNRPLLNSLQILLFLWSIGVLFGIVIDLSPLHTLF
ncbi:MAG: hypothetical protein E7637_04210 [Ruminococcaceae bacterium]|nr:hypothetical protein [Oscillospiraceae bacterium]